MTTRWTAQKALTVRFPPAPRGVRRYRGLPISLRVALFCLVPHVWAGVAVLVVVLWTPAAALFGQDEVATVTNRTVHRGKNGPSYRVEYTYEESGRRYHDSEGVDQSMYGRLSAGTSVAVRSFHIAGLGSSRLGTTPLFDSSFFGPLFFMLFWNTFLTVFFLTIIFRPLRERRLVQLGEVASGVVTGKQIQRGKSTTYYVQYSFTSQAGEAVDGKMTVDKSAYDFAKTGDEVAVFYDPVKPTRSLVYKYIQYRVLDEHGREIVA
jgi:hypothetical protein